LGGGGRLKSKKKTKGGGGKEKFKKKPKPKIVKLINLKGERERFKDQLPRGGKEAYRPNPQTQNVIAVFGVP